MSHAVQSIACVQWLISTPGFSTRTLNLNEALAAMSSFGLKREVPVGPGAEGPVGPGPPGPSLPGVREPLAPASAWGGLAPRPGRRGAERQEAEERPRQELCPGRPPSETPGACERALRPTRPIVRDFGLPGFDAWARKFSAPNCSEPALSVLSSASRGTRCHR